MRSSSLRTAGAGAVVNQAGACACVAWPTMRASTGDPSRTATLSRISTRAAAPSAFAEAAAAVIVPSGRNAGRRTGIFSGETRIGCSSSRTACSPLPGSVTGVISSANTPPVIAARARVRVRTAYASWSWRVKPYAAAVASPKSPIERPFS